MMTTAYALRGGKHGARRLDLLAQVMGRSTEALLDAAGVGPGMTAVDVGCGAGHVSRALAERVGPDGHVVGLDFDPVKLDTARRQARRAGLENVEYRVLDVTTWIEPDSYDVVYGRFIVSHLAERETLVARMVAALRLHGVLVVEDIDFSGAFCQPTNPAYDRYCELYTRVVARKGGDANVGMELYRMCLDAGLSDGPRQPGPADPGRPLGGKGADAEHDDQHRRLGGAGGGDQPGGVRSGDRGADRVHPGPAHGGGLSAGVPGMGQEAAPARGLTASH